MITCGHCKHKGEIDKDFFLRLQMEVEVLGVCLNVLNAKQS